MANAAPDRTPPAGPEARFRAFLREGRFMLQRSRSTGRWVFHPRVVLPGTGETDLEWVEASGRGTVHAITSAAPAADRPAAALGGTLQAAHAGRHPCARRLPPHA